MRFFLFIHTASSGLFDETPIRLYRFVETVSPGEIVAVEIIPGKNRTDYM